MSQQSAEPRPAATLMVLRGGPSHRAEGLEVLMTRRAPQARVMPGIWVFPGGSVDPEDHEAATEENTAFELAARRELAEEAAIELDPGHDVRPWSRWVTPVEVPVRFDTRFFVAKAPPHANPVPDGTEMTEAAWMRPREALERFEAGSIDLIFPTIMHLLMLVRHTTVASVLDAAPASPPDPVQPEIATRGEQMMIVLDGVEYELPRTSALETGGRR